MRGLWGWLRSSFWKFWFYTAGVVPYHGLIPYELTDSDALEYAGSVDLPDGIELSMISVWTEGERPCLGHCYHEVNSSQSHRKNLKLTGGDIHKDYVCCKCTHGRCVTIKEKFVKSSATVVSLAAGGHGGR